MMPRSPNIYWQDAISKGLTIIKVGRALVALQDADRLRVYWHGQEAEHAINTIGAYMRHNQNTTGDYYVQRTTDIPKA